IVAGAAHHGVGTGAAGQRVVTGATGKMVVTFIADDDVVEAVAGAIDRTRPAGQGHGLAAGPQRVVDPRLHGMGAFACLLGHHVAGVVDGVGIVAGATHHGVGPGAAIQRVVAGAAGQVVVALVADDNVAEAVAGAVDRARPAGQ